MTIAFDAVVGVDEAEVGAVGVAGAEELPPYPPPPQAAATSEAAIADAFRMLVLVRPSSGR